MILKLKIKAVKNSKINICKIDFHGVIHDKTDIKKDFEKVFEDFFRICYMHIIRLV